MPCLDLPENLPNASDGLSQSLSPCDGHGLP